jgi:uncharacterized protein YbjQ (UPF0145 family)
VSWPWIKDDLPRFGAFAGEIAASRVAWFVIGMFGVATLLFRRQRPPSPAPTQSPTEPRQAPVQPDAAMEARMGALEADLARVAGELRPALKDLAETHKAGAAEVGRSVAALREAVRSVSDRAGAEREALERKIADAELVATERIDKAKQLFERLFDELRGRQDAFARPAGEGRRTGASGIVGGRSAPVCQADARGPGRLRSGRDGHQLDCRLG